MGQPPAEYAVRRRQAVAQRLGEDLLALGEAHLVGAFEHVAELRESVLVVPERERLGGGDLVVEPGGRDGRRRVRAGASGERGGEGDRARLQGRVVRETELRVWTQRGSLAVAKISIEHTEERSCLVPGRLMVDEPAGGLPVGQAHSDL